MFWFTRQLKRLHRATAPRPEFRAALWSELSSAHDALYASRPRPWAFRFATAGVCALAVVLMTGTGVYAYESPEVTPDHPLYEVRLGIERIEGQFARTPEARNQFRKKLKTRRKAEGEHLIKRLRATIQHRVPVYKSY